MKNQILIVIATLFSLSSFAQKLTKEEKAKKSLCNKHSETIADDFGEGTIIRTKVIRVGPALWVAASRLGNEKKLIISLTVSGSASNVIMSDEIHEFSLYNDKGKVVLKLSPDVDSKPVANTISTGGGYGTSSTPVRISTFTSYSLSYKMTDETMEYFTNYILKAIRIKSIYGEYPIVVDNEDRAKLFQEVIGCIK